MNSMYQDLVTLLTDMVFGGSVEGTVYGTLIVEGFAAFACVLMISLPFLIVWRIIRRFI